MTNSGNSSGYTGTAKTLHWLILALLLVQFVVGWLMPDIERDTVPDTLINLHLSMGATILIVAIVRLGWRLTHSEPAPYDGLPPWQMWSARVIHWSLYVLLFVVPILGWLNASWRGFPVVMFGIELPALIGKRVPGWRWTGDVHQFFAYTMLAIAAVHIAAALYHHFIRKDGVLQRMLPGSGA